MWYFCNHLEMEQNHENVALGKFISESTYERKNHEIQISDGRHDIVLDFYDRKTRTIHEVKKSDKMEEVHVWQVKYYISVLEGNGVEGVKGEINYPKLRQNVTVTLSDGDRQELRRIEGEMTAIIRSTVPPEVINKPFCKKCAYYDLCYV